MFWLGAEPDSEIRERVTRFIAGLLIDPVRPGLYDVRTDVYSLDAVPGTDVGLIWLVKTETREVVLAHVG